MILKHLYIEKKVKHLWRFILLYYKKNILPFNIFIEFDRRMEHKCKKKKLTYKIHYKEGTTAAEKYAESV